jgi:hypothetical protein
MVFDVDVLRSVRSHGVVGELDRSLVVFICYCGTALLLPCWLTSCINCRKCTTLYPSRLTATYSAHVVERATNSC